ncbi:uracil permease, putative [Babesia ovata]|uniref:Uracil permease, putative n=1 Tax=Babesia ovata TaxID=189622 RepID=A0A2H6K8P9_9APIC|nr:uracil permease, putative [Babesia ovata]GBE59382.1 uracil permease, putative [Babesia ovata]
MDPPRPLVAVAPVPAAHHRRPPRRFKDSFPPKITLKPPRRRTVATRRRTRQGTRQRQVLLTVMVVVIIITALTADVISLTYSPPNSPLMSTHSLTSLFHWSLSLPSSLTSSTHLHRRAALSTSSTLNLILRFLKPTFHGLGGAFIFAGRDGFAGRLVKLTVKFLSNRRDLVQDASDAVFCAAGEQH